MRLIDADALNKHVKEAEDWESAYTICAYIDNAPTVEIPNYGGQIVPDTLQGWRYEERPQGDFTRKELVSWLWAIAINNTENELGRSCEEIIHRLDGFERYVSDMREEAAGGNHD